MDRASEISDEKAATNTQVFVAVKDVDTAAELVSGEHGVLDPGEVLRIRFVASKSHYRVLIDMPYVDARSISISSH